MILESSHNTGTFFKLLCNLKKRSGGQARQLSSVASQYRTKTMAGKKERNE